MEKTLKTVTQNDVNLLNFIRDQFRVHDFVILERLNEIITAEFYFSHKIKEISDLCEDYKSTKESYILDIIFNKIEDIDDGGINLNYFKESVCHSQTLSSFFNGIIRHLLKDVN